MRPLLLTIAINECIKQCYHCYWLSLIPEGGWWRITKFLAQRTSNNHGRSLQPSNWQIYPYSTRKKMNPMKRNSLKSDKLNIGSLNVREMKRLCVGTLMIKVDRSAATTCHLPCLAAHYTNTRTSCSGTLTTSFIQLSVNKHSGWWTLWKWCYLWTTIIPSPPPSVNRSRDCCL